MSRSNQHISKALQGLPVYKAPDGIWNRIEAMIGQEQNRHDLNRAVEEMADNVEAPDLVWDNLQLELDKYRNDKPLKEAIRSMPTYRAPDEYVLTQNANNRSLRLSTIKKWAAGIAASVLILASTYYLSIDSKELVTITTTTEVVADVDEIAEVMNGLTEEDEIMELMEEHCSRIVVTCNSPEFKGLYAYYQELDDSKKELLSEIAHHQDVQLVDYLIRVEKEKTEVGKQLIKLILG